jgi:D-inositol-3-phosphate glycosyltransferase
VRLALFGPAPPFHGGIVTYLAMMHRTLVARGHDVHWAGFRQQYPGFLFPGSSQTGETASWMPEPDSVRFVPWDPWSWRRTADDLIAFKPDAVIAKYWLPYFAPGFGSVVRRVRGAGVNWVYVLDNVVAHESYPLAGALTRWALGDADGFVSMSDQVRSDLLTTVPAVDPSRVVDCPHPVYDFGVPGRQRKTRAEARAALGLPADARIALFFGFIKPYKGVVHLIEALPKLREHFGDDDFRMVVVGDVYGDRSMYDTARQKADCEDILDWREGYCPDEDVEDHVLAADLLVLPYVSATQSGIVQVANAYDRPVVSTAVGGLPEVVHDGRTGYLVPPKDSDALAAAVIRYFDENRAAEFGAAVAEERKKYSWDRLAEAVELLASRTS